ncbi:hypothetical protein N657DRAFT_308338 [Parathielavia appendiculata]|uniref:Uncharacterized protein n=1 Tax=Parathielavia appendiculata TaxID=2587402 RepID=A0AAN6U4R5_9PEZI|nr:hypothetical protein N657DRAFT_308338 [Parathielavia appendiculata]
MGFTWPLSTATFPTPSRSKTGTPAIGAVMSPYFSNLPDLAVTRVQRTFPALRANMERKCQGLCDCLTPTCLYANESEQLPAWSPSHLAICSGYEHVVRLLLGLGADAWAVGNATEVAPGLTVDILPVGISAVHSAALQGNVVMCQPLLDHYAARTLDESFDRCVWIMRRTRCLEMLERRDSKGLTPLDYAIAAGHTRTTSAWLLNQDVDPCSTSLSANAAFWRRSITFASSENIMLPRLAAPNPMPA